MHDGTWQPGDDGGNVSFSILSGDTNLFEVDVALQYRIGNLRNYLYATVDPETVLALVVRERLVDIMGRTFIDLIFTNNRDVIQARLFDDAVDYLEANDIGIELLALNIVDLRPIDETVAAFRDVSDAIAESIQTVSDANTRMGEAPGPQPGPGGCSGDERRDQGERTPPAGRKRREGILGSAGRVSEPAFLGDRDAILAAHARHLPRCHPLGREFGRRVGHRHQHDRRVRARCRRRWPSPACPWRPLRPGRVWPAHGSPCPP